jgi:hypothetical protein
MKKLIAILVVFAVMTTALFAQDEGSWSVGGKGQIGTRVDFVPWELRNPDNENSDQAAILVGATSYEDYQNVTGTFSLNYKKGGLETGFSFDQAGSIGASVTYYGAGFRFGAGSAVKDLTAGAGTLSLDKLWGGYTFLDGMIDLHIAVKSGWDHWWNSSTILPGDTYAIVQESNFLKVNVKPIGGLELGFILPGIFDVGLSGWNNNNAATQQNAFTSLNDIFGGPTLGYAGLLDGGYRRFIQDSLERMTFGVKYQVGGINLAAQYGLRGRPEFRDTAGVIKDAGFLNSVIYLGAQYNLTSAMTIDLEGKGEFFKSFDTNRVNPDPKLEDVSRTALAFGGRFRYTADPLQAYLSVMYFNDIWFADTNIGGRVGGGNIATTENAGRRAVENGVLRLRPFVSYKIISSHLFFRVDTLIDLPLGDYYLNRYDPYDKADKDAAEAEGKKGPGKILAYTLGYQVVPELFFNILGTGATADGLNMDGGFNGVLIRYRVAGLVYSGSVDDLVTKRTNSPTRNAFDMIFRWSF